MMESVALTLRFAVPPEATGLGLPLGPPVTVRECEVVTA
jgi:hypothetical protein